MSYRDIRQDSTLECRITLRNKRILMRIKEMQCRVRTTCKENECSYR